MGNGWTYGLELFPWKGVWTFGHYCWYCKPGRLCWYFWERILALVQKTHKGKEWFLLLRWDNTTWIQVNMLDGGKKATWSEVLCINPLKALTTAYRAHLTCSSTASRSKNDLKRFLQEEWKKVALSVQVAERCQATALIALRQFRSLIKLRTSMIT